MGFILADLQDLRAVFHDFFFVLFFFLAEEAKREDLKHLLASVVKDSVELFFFLFFFPIRIIRVWMKCLQREREDDAGRRGGGVCV